MRRKFLSVVLCVCMMLTMAPFAFAEGSDDGATTEIGAEGGSSNTSSSGSGGTTLQAQINAINSTGTITLNRTYTEDVTIPADKNITLNLNGQKLTNKTTNTITVEKGATLTVTGTGTVDNITHGKAALYNKGTVVLEGGTFERSAEAGIDATNNGGNSYYTVLNHGSMTVKSNVTVNNKGHYSSLFENGYFDCTQTQDGIEAPSLIIDDGKFDGGLNTIKNDDNATLTINDGTFINYTQAALQNHHIATINGGTFTATDANAVLNCGVCSEVNSDHDDHVITIKNGTFTGAINCTVGSISISGGTYSVDVSDFCAEGYYSVKDREKYTVKPLNEVAVAKIGDILYPTLAKAIEAVPDNGESATTVTLIKDSTEDVTIPANKKVALELNGKTLTNKNDSTITVALGAELTVTGTGTVDNVTHAKAAIWNNGTCTLSGGNYTRTKENGISAENNGGNSFYTVLNHGTMTINDGVTIFQKGHYSSLLENGYQNAASGNQGTGYVNGVNAECPSLTINGGLLTGGLNTVKNDDNGKIAIKNGTFTNYTQSAFQNHHIATINGGTFDGANVCAVLNCGACSSVDATHDKHETTITGGYFNGNLKKTVGSITISGGYFTSDPSAYVASDHYTVDSSEDGYSYMVTNQQPSSAPVIVEDKTETANSIENENVKNSVDAVINNANVDGVAEAVNKDSILTAASVPNSDKADKNAKIVIDVQVNVKATGATTTTTSGGSESISTLTFSASPQATVKKVTVSGSSNYNNGKPIDLPNSYLNGKEITVKLPLPSGFTPVQIKHTSSDGSVEYFLSTQKRGAKTFTIEDSCAVFTITKFSTFEVSGTQTYVEPSSGGSISTPTTYAVNVNAATNGAVAADKKTASKGTTVTVTASPSKGYVVDAVKVVDKDGKDVAVTEKDGKYVFTMPASAVTVTGSFKAETPAPVALPFTDVKSGNWFYDAVKYAYEQGLMTGTSATTFAPNGTMNRAMIVTVLYRLEKSPAVTGASKFTDVPAGQWYSDAVAWAAANKIVNGYDETTFGPMNAVTREQMAAILFRYEQVKGLENVTLEENLNRFPDQNKISAYAIPALQWAVGQKIINGNADGTLDPTGTATRAQVAQIFTNLLNQ